MLSLFKKNKPVSNTEKKQSHDVNLVDLISPGGLKMHSNYIQIGKSTPELFLYSLIRKF